MKRAFEAFASEHIAGPQPEAYVFDKDFVINLLQEAENCAYLKIYFGMEKGKLQLILAPAAGNKVRIPIPTISSAELVSNTGTSGGSVGSDNLADKGGACPPPWGDV